MNKGEWCKFFVIAKLLSDESVSISYFRNHSQSDGCAVVTEIALTGRHHVLVRSSADDALRIYVDGSYHNYVSLVEIRDLAYHFLLEIVSNEKSESIGSQFLSMVGLSGKSLRINNLKLVYAELDSGQTREGEFSIHSELGSLPSLLNASRQTNFIFQIEGPEKYPISQTAIDSKHLKQDLSKLEANGVNLKFTSMTGAIFTANLEKIGPQLPYILSVMLRIYFTGGPSRLDELASIASKDGVLAKSEYEANHVSDLVSRFLATVFLGMKPATLFNSEESGLSGLIKLTRNGSLSILKYDGLSSLGEYLLTRTKLETASTSRHSFGQIYYENGSPLINLNLQIRYVRS